MGGRARRPLRSGGGGVTRRARGRAKPGAGAPGAPGLVDGRRPGKTPARAPYHPGRPRATPRDPGRLVATPADSRQPPATPGDPRRLPATPGDSPRLRATPGDSRRLRASIGAARRGTGQHEGAGGACGGARWTPHARAPHVLTKVDTRKLPPQTVPLRVSERQSEQGGQEIERFRVLGVQAHPKWGPGSVQKGVGVRVGSRGVGGGQGTHTLSGGGDPENGRPSGRRARASGASSRARASVGAHAAKKAPPPTENPGPPLGLKNCKIP